jgi:NADH dehydrogenase
LNVFVTGVNGFLGRALASELAARGHRVSGSVSAADRLAHAPQCAGGCHVLRLDEDFDPAIFRGVDSVVHCAHDFWKGRGRANVDGTKKIARAAAGQGVAAQIFVGSYSAHERATSEYGKTKLELEEFFSRSDYTVAKPGLVIGDGGLFSKMYGLFRRYPVLPLVGGGAGKVPVVGLRDLTGALVQLVERPRPGVYRLYLPELVTLSELFRSIRAAGNFKTVLMPVPFAVVGAGVRALSWLGFNLEIDEENLKGFQANQNVEAPTDLGEFVPRPSTLGEMVSAAARAADGARSRG